MPGYQKIPPLQTWVLDCLGGIDSGQGPRPGRSEVEAQMRRDHVLDSILDLLSEYDSIRSEPKAKKQFRKHLIVVYLREATQFWLKKGDRAPKTAAGPNPGEARFARAIPEAVGPAVQALHDVAGVKLVKYYDWLQPDDVSGIRQALAKSGVGVVNTEAEEDARRLKEGGMVWLKSDEDRFGYKLRFRNGLAYRVRRSGQRGEEVEVEPFSTSFEESELGDSKTHFVMDSRGRIYCGYDRQRARAFKFFHSSLVGGEPAMAAGMMKIDRGQVVLIANSSGHYRPDGRHMAAVLQRLRLYGVPLSRLAVEHFETRKTFSPEDVLRWNGWPKP